MAAIGYVVVLIFFGLYILLYLSETSQWCTLGEYTQKCILIYMEQLNKFERLWAITYGISYWNMLYGRVYSSQHDILFS